jgi:hypothetical protein
MRANPDNADFGGIGAAFQRSLACSRSLESFGVYSPRLLCSANG